MGHPGSLGRVPAVAPVGGSKLGPPGHSSCPVLGLSGWSVCISCWVVAALERIWSEGHRVAFLPTSVGSACLLTWIRVRKGSLDLLSRGTCPDPAAAACSVAVTCTSSQGREDNQGKLGPGAGVAVLQLGPSLVNVVQFSAAAVSLLLWCRCGMCPCTLACRVVAVMGVGCL